MANWTLVLTGLFMILVGGVCARFPQHIRSLPTGREWRDDPEAAARKQELFGKALGLFFAVAVGGPLVVAGVLG